MEWLSDWIQQIILLVLIATFIDLLLPNQSFDRYVKLVMGLLIIMAILSPIFQLLKKEMDLSAWMAEFERGQSKSTMASLEQIKGESTELKQWQTNQISQQWEKNLEREMQNELQQTFSLREVSVNVEAMIKDQQSPQIKRVNVHVPSSQKQLDDPELGKPVQPVDIQIAKEDHGAPESGQNETSISIRRYLEKTWNLKAEQIHVLMESS